MDYMTLDFPDSPVGKESACNAGDPSSIPGLGWSPGEGKGYPPQRSGLENSMDYSMGSQRVGHDWATFISLHVNGFQTSYHYEPFSYSPSHQIAHVKDFVFNKIKCFW